MSLKRKISNDDDVIENSPKKVATETKLDDLNNKRETTTVLVKNLPKSTNIHQIKQFFSDCGCVLFVDFMKHLQLAKLQFRNYDEALSALTKTFKRFNIKNPNSGKGNEITVEWYRNSTVWCTNYPPTYTLVNLRELFQQLGGTVINIRTPSLRYNSNRRFAYIDMLSSSEAQACVDSLNGRVIEGKYKLVAKLSDPSLKSQRTDQSLLEGREILLKNIENIDEISIREYLTTNGGEIEKFSIPKTNNSIAWCSFVIKQSVDNLINKSITFKIGEQIIYITKADKKAYLERQKIKSLFSLPKSDPKYDLYISLFPVSDKYSKERIKSIVVSHTSLSDIDIQEVLLVSDHQGALICLKESKQCSKTILELNGKNLNKNTLLTCGDIKALQFFKPEKTGSTDDYEESFNKGHDIAAPAKNLMTNADFKNMLYK